MCVCVRKLSIVSLKVHPRAEHTSMLSIVVAMSRFPCLTNLCIQAHDDIASAQHPMQHAMFVHDHTICFCAHTLPMLLQCPMLRVACMLPLPLISGTSLAAFHVRDHPKSVAIYHSPERLHSDQVLRLQAADAFLVPIRGLHA